MREFIALVKSVLRALLSPCKVIERGRSTQLTRLRSTSKEVGGGRREVQVGMMGSENGPVRQKEEINAVCQ